MGDLLVEEVSRGRRIASGEMGLLWAGGFGWLTAAICARRVAAGLSASGAGGRLCSGAGD